MKRIIYNLFLCLMFLPFVSCESEDLGQHLKDTDVITLNLYTSSPVSRVMQDELHEYALSHLDVFIFTDAVADDQKSKVHYERILTNVSPEGEVTLTGKKRNDFDHNTGYWVYVLANSTATETVLSGITNLAGLKEMTQEDPLLHLTATSASNAPKNFLMDGIAFSGDTEPVTPGTVVLNDGTAAKTTELNVKLNRAAAKVVVELSKGNNVTFHQNKEEGYYLRNLPTVTTLLAGTTLPAGTPQKLVTTTKSVTAYSTFTAEKVTVTAYVYAHSWEKETFFRDGTSMVLNIPLTYDEDPNDSNSGTNHDNSFYQIELRHKEDRNFDRNHYYLITGTINAPGATENTQPVDLDNLKYQALDWTEKTINVGGEEKPTYLKVNKDTLRIYNQAIDESLVFASSSPVTISVHGEVEENNSSLEGSSNPYFYNKFGVKTLLSGSNGNFTEMVSGNNQTSPVTISAVPDTGLSGNIKVESTIPANNAVRYFALLITNEDGLKEKVLVEQYPVIYITNILGWYSYRSDFKSGNNAPTTYENGNYPYYNCASWNNNGWSYERKRRTDWGNQPFFFSKVNTSTRPSGDNQGKSDLYYYHYTNNGTRDDNNFVIYKNAEDNNNERGGNARMYHVHVTATSGNYTVGRPRLDANGYPVNATDNARLVSPSFYIASQLGATQNPSSYTQAVTHCANYVETYKKVVYDSNGNPVLDSNGNNTGETVHLDDWRLPTAAEVEIILQYQYGQTGTTPTVAMDEVLAGENYYCVNPTNDNKVKNTRQDPNGNSTNTYVRCVRDAY